MRIERERMGELINERAKKCEDERGMQPLLVFGCFYDLNIENDSVCILCRNYKTCRLYLKAFEREDVFGELRNNKR